MNVKFVLVGEDDFDLNMEVWFRGFFGFENLGFLKISVVFLVIS